MIISHITLKNWRNFREVNVDLGNRVFLVGPNASGKSNFLDAIRFLRDIAKPGGGLQKSVLERGGMSKIRCLAARQHPGIEIEVELTDFSQKSPLWKYSIGIMQQERGLHLPKIIYERVIKEGTTIIERPDKEDKKDTMRLTQTHLEQINANERFRDIAKFFESITYLHMIPQLLQRPDAFTGYNLPGDPYGRFLLETIARTPKTTQLSRLSKIERALKTAVPQLSHLALNRDGVGIPHLEAKYEHWRSKGAYQKEDQFSDGTLRLIGLLWALLDGDSLLLFEEPELSLNSGIIMKLPRVMYQLQQLRKRQIILSTHSADLLFDKGISGEEVLLLIPTLEGTVLRVASSIREIRDLLAAGLSAGEAVIPHTKPKQLELELFKSAKPYSN
jgi:predicted ATPase